MAGTPVLAGVGRALVDVVLAVPTPKAADALTLVVADLVQARPAVEARVWGWK